MPIPPVSVQLFSIRDFVDADLPDALRRLAAIGFTAVEPYGFAPDADLYAELLPASGLVAPSAHNYLIGEDLDEVFAAAHTVGVGTIIDPHIDEERWRTRDDVGDIARDLNEIGRRAKDAGLRIGYHNHSTELSMRIDGVSALEVLADRLDDDVVLEVDAYWAEVGGEAAPALLRRLGERVGFIHLKDGLRREGALASDGSGQVAVGAGELPVADILDAAPQAVVVLELDEIEGDTFEALADSLRYLDDRSAA